MEHITLYDKTFKIYIPYKDIESAIDKVAEKMNEDFAGSNEIPILLCVLNGSIMFTSELMKRLNFDCELVSTKMTSYCGTTSTGKVNQTMGLTANITGRKVIIVEDIVDSGHTIVELKNILKKKGASECLVCTLLHKPDACIKDLPLDYVAITIPNRFIVGFGLDYNEIGRNYKDIYVLDE
ncbi:MAG: hypoxanthine phosphoribosyltransferase [Candidatus Cryptobacteroides sp.]